MAFNPNSPVVHISSTVKRETTYFLAAYGSKGSVATETLVRLKTLQIYVETVPTVTAVETTTTRNVILATIESYTFTETLSSFTSTFFLPESTFATTVSHELLLKPAIKISTTSAAPTAETSVAKGSKSKGHLAIEIVVPIFVIGCLLLFGAFSLYKRSRRKRRDHARPPEPSDHGQPMPDIIRPQAPGEVVEMQERPDPGELEAPLSPRAELESPIAELDAPGFERKIGSALQEPVPAQTGDKKT